MSPTLESLVLPPILKAAADRGATPEELLNIFVASLEKAFERQPDKRREVQEAQLRAAGRVGRKALLAEEGGCVPSAAAAKLYLGTNPEKAANPETVRKAARENRLIAVRDGHGDWLFPAWQFAEGGGALPGLAKTLKLLKIRPGFSEITPVRFFLQGHPMLEDRPLDALRAGDVDGVLDAAIAQSD